MRSSPLNSEAAGAATVEALAHAHGCLSGCTSCAAERAEAPAVDPLWHWYGFVQSDAARRAGRLTLRTGRPFPHMSTDEVTQFCIEEAVIEAVQFIDRHRELLASLPPAESPPVAAPGSSGRSPHEQAGANHALAMATLKGGS